MSKAMSGQASPNPNPAPASEVPSKYSNRVVVLKTVLESGGGSGLVGHRVVVGGWVKSSKLVHKEAPPSPQATAPAPAPADGGPRGDVSCSEILQSRIPFFRTIIKILGGNSSGSVRERFESVAPRPAVSLPSTAFLQLSDGSCASSLLVVVESSVTPTNELLPTGTCIVAEGELKDSSIEGKNVIELKVEKVLHIGTVESDKYPLSKKRLPLNSLRDFPHLRPRTTTVATVMRIRSGLSSAVHAFSEKQGFLSVQLPTITATDSEPLTAAADKLYVTLAGNLSKKQEARLKAKMADDADGVSLEAVRAAVKEKSMIVEDLKRSESNKEALVAAARDLQKTAELASRLEAREARGGGGGEEVSFSPGKSHLVASGRLHLESFACSMGNVYAFGPRFRAAKNESPKEVSEMWTVEIEMAFSQLEDAMNCAEDFFRFLCKWVLQKCSEDMKFVVKRMDRISVDRLQSVLSTSIDRITYNEALDALKKAGDNKKSTETKLEWGASLTTEHLSYLVDEIYKRPVIVYNYPKQVKPFFARLNDDRRTVAAFDMVVPKVGVLISGSQNEDRLNMLSSRIKELGLAGDDYEWYLDLRRHGTVKHAGFSLAFDHMVRFTTGLADVRDVIPFPKSL